MALAAAATLLIGNGAAEAAVVMTLSESGGDVTLAASGTLKITALSGPLQNGASGYIRSLDSTLTTGGSNVAGTSRYEGAILGSAPFGSRATGLIATSGSGDTFGVYGNVPEIVTPLGYVSGAPLSGTATWSGETFSSLGLIAGSYVYSWGAGADADTLTVNVGTAVPEPSASLLGLAGALSLLRRRRKSA